MDKDIETYIDDADDDRKALYMKLHDLITKLYPDAQAVMSYQIPTYRFGRGWVGIGYWKEGVSLYTNGPQNVNAFKKRHPEIKAGKGSLNFKLSDDFHETSLQQVIKTAMEPQEKKGGPNPGRK